MLHLTRKNKPLIHDPYIIPRVQKYLEENVDQTYVDVSVMARQLQLRYHDYMRRKAVPFQKLVEYAYKCVLRSYGLESNGSGEDNSDLELTDVNGQSNPNRMNNMLTSVYSKNADKVVTKNEELIDISSDDSETEDSRNYAGKKSINKTEEKSSGNLNIKTIQKLPNLLPVNTFPANITVRPILKKRKIDGSEELSAPSGKSFKIQPIKNSNELQQAPSTTAKNKRYKKNVEIKGSYYFFSDIGGLDRVLKELCELLFHFHHPNVYYHLGLVAPKGFLLHGPPGCGKTLLARAIAGQLKIGIIEIAATELVAGVSGESEERIRDIFEQATTLAPCVLFIDEIDAICSNRLNAQKDMERRIVSQLISSMDTVGEQVIIIGATTRPEVLDPSLRRVGRFENEISIGIPDRNERAEIFSLLTQALDLKSPFDVDSLATLTPGFVGADFVALISRAGSIAIKRAIQHSYCLRQARMQKTIPVVDLIEENVNDDVKKDDENLLLTKDKPEELVEKTNESDSENKVDEKVDKNDEDKSTDNVEKDKSLDNGSSKLTNIENKDEDIPMEINDELSGFEKNNQTSKINIEQDMEIDNIIGDSNNRNQSVMDDDVKLTDQTETEKIEMDSMVYRKNLTLKEMIACLQPEIKLLDENFMENFSISYEDFIEALKFVKPTAKREGFITVPDVSWDDIGSLKDIRDELQLAILAPVKYPQKLQALGLNTPSGVLLCGPPGCGKTLLAKAIANEAGINFISVKGPELMNMYVGESERAVRQCFQRARNSAPCVIFFDEFDSLCPKRSESNESGSGTRVVNQLLTELDGIEERKSVYIMAATNRPDIIDPAVLRPGRFDTILYVDMPNINDRLEIIKALTKNGTQPPLCDDVNLEEIATNTEYYTGADLAGLIRQASLFALRDSINDTNTNESSNEIAVSKQHLLNALNSSKPSICPKERDIYAKLKQKYSKKLN